MPNCQPPPAPVTRFLNSVYSANLRPIVDNSQDYPFVEKDELGPFFEVRHNIRDTQANYKALSSRPLTMLAAGSANLTALL